MEGTLESAQTESSPQDKKNYANKSAEKNIDVHHIIIADEKQSQIEEAKKIFKQLYGKIPEHHFAYLFTKQGIFPFAITDETQIEAMAFKAIELSDKGIDVWHSVNTVSIEPKGNKRGDESVVSFQTAIVVDIDILSDAHKSTNLVTDFNEAKSFLPFQPSLTIHSGHGGQFYYIFDQPIKITNENREELKHRNNLFLDVIRQLAKGKKIDGVGDLPRVMRTPGTFNRKLSMNNSPLCHIVEDSGLRFAPTDIDTKLNEIIQTQKQEAQSTLVTPIKSTLKNNKDLTDDRDFNLFRACRMLDFISPSSLTYDDWLAVGMALKNIGCDCVVWEHWSRADERFKDGECQYKWNGFDRDGYDFGTLYYFAAPNGYDAKETYREYLQLHPELAKEKGSPRKSINKHPANESSDFDIKKLCEGLKPIKLTAGAILNVADADTKPALEILFKERNFDEFISLVIDNDAEDNDKISGFFTEEQVRKALTWLITKLYPYFVGKTEALKKLIKVRLTACTANSAIDILCKNQFFDETLRIVKENFTGEPFSFEKNLRRELESFAKHSPEVYNALIRFDYSRLEKFLSKDFTDVTCAELLIDVQRDFLRFDVKQKTWYIWSDNHWEAVTANSNAQLYDLWTPLARKIRIFAEYNKLKIYCELEDFEINNPDYRKAKTAQAEKHKRLEFKTKEATLKFRATAMLESSRAIGNYFEQASGLPEPQIETKDLDTNNNLFNAQNCTIALETMKTYKARQEDLITLTSLIEYNPNARSAVWNDFIKSAIPNQELRDWLQRYFGYCLCGDIAEHLFLFIYGIGGSGKTTFLNAIVGAMGDYAKIFPVSMITENRKEKDGNEPEPALAALRNCRLAVSSETKKNKRLDEAFIKLLTGGNKLTTRELHKPNFEFTPHFKIVIDGNFLLRISDINDVGLQRRIRIAPFNSPPDKDKIDTSLSKKLATPESKAAIFNWLIEGWQKYQERGLKDVPATMAGALDNFYNSNDTISTFLEAHNYTTGDKDLKQFRVAVVDVWQTYNNWQRRTPGAPTFSRADFVDSILQSLKDDGVEVKKISNKDFFVGFKIDSSEPVLPPE